jgi:hypothetical protein
LPSEAAVASCLDRSQLCPFPAPHRQQSTHGHPRRRLGTSTGRPGGRRYRHEPCMPSSVLLGVGRHPRKQASAGDFSAKPLEVCRRAGWTNGRTWDVTHAQASRPPRRAPCAVQYLVSGKNRKTKYVLPALARLIYASPPCYQIQTRKSLSPWISQVQNLACRLPF